MGGRPSGIVGNVAVELPRPRERLSRRFADYHLRLRQMLEEGLAARA